MTFHSIYSGRAVHPCESVNVGSGSRFEGKLCHNRSMCSDHALAEYPSWAAAEVRAVRPGRAMSPLQRAKRDIDRRKQAVRAVDVDRTEAVRGEPDAPGVSDEAAATALSSCSFRPLIVKAAYASLEDRGAHRSVEILADSGGCRGERAAARRADAAPRVFRAWRPLRTRSSGSCATDLLALGRGNCV